MSGARCRTHLEEMGEDVRVQACDPSAACTLQLYRVHATGRGGTVDYEQMVRLFVFLHRKKWSFCVNWWEMRAPECCFARYAQANTITMLRP